MNFKRLLDQLVVWYSGDKLPNADDDRKSAKTAPYSRTNRIITDSTKSLRRRTVREGKLGGE